MNIILYKSKTCAQCKVIQMKLDRKGIPYTFYTNDDNPEIFEKLGIKSIPQLQIDNNPPMTNLTEINKWINSWEGESNG